MRELGSFICSSSKDVDFIGDFSACSEVLSSSYRTSLLETVLLFL